MKDVSTEICVVSLIQHQCGILGGISGNPWAGEDLCAWREEGGRGGGGSELPASHILYSRFPFRCGSLLFVLFLLQNIIWCCKLFLISPSSRHLGNPASRPLFSRLPYTSRPFYYQVPAPRPPLEEKCLFTQDINATVKPTWSSSA